MTRSTRGQRGFTLLEVLIAVLVMSIGLLGVGTLQFTSLKGSQDAYVRSQAAFLAYGITDSMRVNLPAARTGQYDVALGGTFSSTTKTCIGAAANCTPPELAVFDLMSWKQDLGQTLVEGNGTIATDVDPITGVATVTVTVWWKSMQGSGEDQSLIVEVDI